MIQPPVVRSVPKELEGGFIQSKNTNKTKKKEKENFSSNFTREQAPVATQTHRLFFGRDVEVVKSFHDLAIVRLLIILTNVFACS